MRVGVVGLGRIGRMHARWLDDHPDVKTVVLCSRDRTKAEGLAANLDSVNEIVEHPSEIDADIDGVVVSASTPTHPALIRHFAALGVPVLCEKPAADTWEELTSLVAEVEPTGTPVMVGFQRRCDPGYRMLRQKVVQGGIGRVQMVRATAHDRTPPDPAFVPGSGGIWRDLLIHDFDALHWLLGERAVRVTAQGTAFGDAMYEDHSDVHTAAALIEFEGGALAVVTGTRENRAGQDCRLEVFGDRGSLCAGLDSRMPLWSTEPGVPAPARTHPDFLARFKDAFELQTGRFLDLVRGRRPNPAPLSAGLHSLEIALACERSRAAGGSATIGPAPPSS